MIVNIERNILGQHRRPVGHQRHADQKRYAEELQSRHAIHSRMTRHQRRLLHPLESNCSAKAKYDLVREAIVSSVRDHGEITFKALTEDVGHRLVGCLDGSVSWYVTSVKLDPEARGVGRRIPRSRPQRICLV